MWYWKLPQFWKIWGLRNCVLKVNGLVLKEFESLHVLFWISFIWIMYLTEWCHVRVFNYIMWQIWTENKMFVYNNQQCVAFQIQMFDSHLLNGEVDSLKPSWSSNLYLVRKKTLKKSEMVIFYLSVYCIYSWSVVLVRYLYGFFENMYCFGMKILGYSNIMTQHFSKGRWSRLRWRQNSPWVDLQLNVQKDV